MEKSVYSNSLDTISVICKDRKIIKYNQYVFVFESGLVSNEINFFPIHALKNCPCSICQIYMLVKLWRKFGYVCTEFGEN